MAPFALHDVDDVPKLVSAVITRSGLVLSFHDREDLQQELVIHAWTISETFDPARGSFSNYVFRTASLRIADWQRRRLGRTVWKFKDRVYERPRTELVSLDAGGLDDAVGSLAGDPAACSDPSLERLLATGDRQEAEDLRTLGLEPSR